MATAAMLVRTADALIANAYGLLALFYRDCRCIFINVSPAESNLHETGSTLNFGSVRPQ